MTQRRHALVTGGATGIGRSAVLALARAGFDIAIVYGSSAKAAQAVAGEAESLGARTLLLQCDVSDDAAVRRTLAEIGEVFGHLDALVNNAGTTATWKVKDLESLDMAEWDRTFAVNVRGTFQVSRAAVPLLRKGTNPAIVNTASIVGLRPGPQPLPYAASKAALISLAKTLSAELLPRGIRVNVVSPGPIATPIYGKLGLDAETLEKTAAGIQAQIPLVRFGTPQELASTVLHLAAPESAFIVGTEIIVDGGMSQL